MSSIYLKFFFIIGLLGCVLNVFAQTYHTIQFTSEDGLPSDCVNCVARANDGYIWIGTDNGLVKWDRHCSVYSNSSGLPNNNISAIVCGNDSDLWVGTHGGGLCLMQDSKIVQLFSDKDGIAGDYINSLYFSKKEQLLFVGSTQGLSVGNRSKFYSYRSNKLDVTNFHELDTAVLISTAANGMFYYHFKKKMVFNFRTFAQLPGEDIYNFHFTANGDSLFAIRDKGLWLINGTRRIFYPCDAKVSKFADDNNGHVWISSVENDGQLGELFYLNNYQLTPFSLHLNIRPKSFNTVWFEPVEHALFIGTRRHGFLLLPNLTFEQFLAKTEMQTHLLFDVCEDDASNLWVVGDRQWKVPLQEIVLPYKPLLFNNYLSDFLVKDRLTKGYIRSFCNTPKGILMLDDGDLFLIDKVSNARTPLVLSEQGKCKYMKYLDGYLFTSYEDRFSIFRFSDLKLVASNTINSDIKDIRKINNRFWLLYENGVLERMNASFKSSENLCNKYPFISSSVSFISEDKRDNIWLTNGNSELLLLSDLQGELKLVDKWILGTNLPGKLFQWLLVDSHDNLWVGTNKTLSRINLTDYYQKGSKDFHSWCKGDGYDCSTSIKAIESSTGVLWILAGSKVIRLYPENLKLPNQAPQIRLVQLSKNGKMIDLKSLLNADGGGYKINDISFTSQENTIGFSFDVLNLTYRDRVLFKYQLLPRECEFSSPSQQPTVFFPALSPGRYVFKVQAYFEHSPDKITELEYAFNINPPLHKSIYAFVFYGIITLVIVLVVLDFRVNRVRKSEEQKNKMRESVALLKMEALQSQMNPHFIFNALNSLQYSILDNDTEKSLNFISLFSKLMRATLDNASKHVITLSEEIDYLENYMQVEKMRFLDGFHYAISVSDNITPDELFIPPMLLQPHVENSIKYAFTSSSIGYIIISFSKVDNKLICMIEDNGVGRDKTLNRARTHKPKGQLITRERFEILNEFYQTFNEYSFEVEDLFDEDKHPSGTRVTLIFPVIEKSESYISMIQQLYDANKV